MILFLIALFSSSAYSQCDLTLDDLPAFHGLKFGMTVEQVSGYLNLKLILNNKLTAPDPSKPEEKVYVGEETVTLKNISHPSFKGAGRLKLGFFRNKLYEIKLDYNQSYATWKNIAEFEDQISKQLKLPREAWQDVRTFVGLRCRDFSITAFIIEGEPYYTYFSMINNEASQIVKELATEKLKRSQ